MKPLLYLTVRTLVNGVKRSFSSPTRTLGVLFFIFTQLWWLPRFIFGGSKNLDFAFPGTSMALPPVVVIDAVVFVVFCFFTVLFALNVFNYRGSFRVADVDVLFPTPIDPRTVLTIKVLRDIWLSLLVPLVLGFLMWGPTKAGWNALFAGVKDPAMATNVLRLGMLAYFVSAIAWVWIGHAASLALSKPDTRTDRLRTVLTWAVFLVFLGVGASVYLRVRNGPFPDAFVSVAHALDLRAVFFLASAAASVTLLPLTGDGMAFAIGAIGLVGTLVAAVWIARRNTAWMYETAAMRAAVTENTIKIRKSGDLSAIAVQRAQSGKLRAGRTGWLSRIRCHGPASILWKEALVAKRSSLAVFLLFLLLSIGMAQLSAVIPETRRGMIGGYFLLFLQSMLLIGPTMGQAQGGFIESLRRIDLLKPLPFSAQSIVFMEVLSKAVPAILTSSIGLLSALVAKIALWPFVVAGLLIFPPLVLALSAVSLLLVVLLPDVEDPTQRSFRGLATLLGMVASTGPPIALFALLVFLKVPVVVAALPTAALMAALCWLATWLAGRTYSDFNPAD